MCVRSFTIVDEAIPADLLRRLKICHAQACKRIRETKPQADWSWESDNPGVVDCGFPAATCRAALSVPVH